MKKILVIYYTQSGQLKEVLDRCTLDLKEDTTIDFFRIKPVQPYPFPWDQTHFFDVFPETYNGVSIEIEAPEESILASEYDLVILGYQPWFLSPSQPSTSFLKSEFALKLLANRKVITIIACRNMWTMAHENVKRLLVENKAQLVGNIVLVDRGLNQVSVISMVDWMFTGHKRRYLGIFPLPGVSDEDIDQSRRFGPTILKHLKEDKLDTLQQALVEQGAVPIKYLIAGVEKTGHKIFAKWANFISKRGKSRKLWLNVFYIYLIICIWVVAPIVLIFRILLIPFTLEKKKRTISYLQNILLN